MKDLQHIKINSGNSNRTHGQDLQEKISNAINRLKIQRNKLENAVMGMRRYDRELFDKCVSSQMVKDSARAALYANECAEVRKMATIALRNQLALEVISLRLEIIREFGAK